MVEVNLKYLSKERSRHGKWRLYVRFEGKRFRLAAPEASPAFLVEYARALKRLRTPAERPPKAAPQPRMLPNTFEWLGEQYMASTAFRGLDATSQRNRRGIFESCFAEPLKPGGAEKIGQCSLSRLQAKHIRLLRDRKADKPGAANNRLKYIKVMLGWAVETDLMSVNIARDVKSLRYQSDGFYTWEEEDVQKFEQRWPIGTKQRLALALLMFVGTRRSDAVKLGPQHVRNSWFKFKPRKTKNSTGVIIELPVLEELADVLAASPLGDPAFLVTEKGKPFTANGFGNWFREACDEADLPQCSSHGLRKAGATRAAERGATTKQLMAIFGWSDPKQAEKYIKKADQKRLAKHAVTLLARDESENEIVAPRLGATVAPKRKACVSWGT